LVRRGGKRGFKGAKPLLIPLTNNLVGNIKGIGLIKIGSRPIKI
jgi:hypothetical protein